MIGQSGFRTSQAPEPAPDDTTPAARRSVTGGLRSSVVAIARETKLESAGALRPSRPPDVELVDTLSGRCTPNRPSELAAVVRTCPGRSRTGASDHRTDVDRPGQREAVFDEPDGDGPADAGPCTGNHRAGLSSQQPKHWSGWLAAMTVLVRVMGSGSPVTKSAVWTSPPRPGTSPAADASRRRGRSTCTASPHRSGSSDVTESRAPVQ